MKGPRRSPAPMDSGHSVQILCDLCGSPMIDFNCELICVHCGFRRDCSDP